MLGIAIEKTGIWNKSYKRLKTILKNKNLICCNGHEPSIYINFSDDFHDNNTNTLVLNRNVTNARDKVKMNKLLDELNILHPKTYYYPFLDLPKDKEECIIKPQFRGGMGRNIILTTFNKIKYPEEYDSCFIQQLIPFDREFRVIVFNGESIAAREKISDEVIKNRESSEIVLTAIKSLEDFAVEVAKRMKIDFCGADIGMYDGHYFVIELNSAPGISWDLARIIADKLQLLEMAWRLKKCVF